MSDFKEFRARLQDHFNEMVKVEHPLFITDADEDSLLTVKSAEDAELANKIELVKYIVSVKLAEADERMNAAEKKAQRDKIMEIVAKKKDKELEDMNVDQLMKKLEELN